MGAVLGGGIEMASQLYKNGSVTDWGDVGGSALQGRITGGVAGLTNGANLLVTAGAGGAANAVGGGMNRAIQGQETTVTDVVIGAAIGAGLATGGKVIGNLVKGAADDLSNAAKGKLGEAVTEIKYGTQGYKSAGNDVVKTGGKTASGRPAEARFDHKMTNVFNGKKIKVESKLNTSGYTPNQQVVVNKGYPIILDKTTSQWTGNVANTGTGGIGAGIDAQRNK